MGSGRGVWRGWMCEGGGNLPVLGALREGVWVPGLQQSMGGRRETPAPPMWAGDGGAL